MTTTDSCFRSFFVARSIDLFVAARVKGELAVVAVVVEAVLAGAGAATAAAGDSLAPGCMARISSSNAQLENPFAAQNS